LSNDFPILNYEKVIKKITRFISDKVRTRKNNNMGGNCGDNHHYMVGLYIYVKQ